MNKKSKIIAVGAMTAALYAVLTVSLSFISYGPVQFRISEALTVLPFFFPITVIGLTAGCLISSLFSPYMLMDLIFGTLATLIGSAGTYLLSKRNLWYLAPLPPVISNTIIVGLVITYQELNGIELNAFLFNASTVALGEAVCCYGLGLPLLMYIKKRLKQ